MRGVSAEDVWERCRVPVARLCPSLTGPWADAEAAGCRPRQAMPFAVSGRTAQQWYGNSREAGTSWQILRTQASPFDCALF